VLLLAAMCLAAALFLAADALTQPARRRRIALRCVLRAGGAPAGDAPEPGFRERVVAPLGGRLAGFTLRLSPQTTADSVRARLIAAGRREVSPTAFLAGKAGLAIGGLVLGSALAAPLGPTAGVGLATALAGGGFIAPDLLLTSRARRRRELVQSELPDTLDLLAVSVEAGLGFDAAIAKLIEHMEGTLPEELSLALSEMRIGRSRQEALRKMAERVDAPEMSAFVRAVIQAEQLGISLSRILKVQAEDARRRRQTAAEEQAMKAPVKMLFPTVLFIFPAMFIVILGPAILSFGEVF